VTFLLDYYNKMIYFGLDEVLNILDEIEKEVSTTGDSVQGSKRYTIWSRIVLNKVKKRVIARAKSKQQK